VLQDIRNRPRYYGEKEFNSIEHILTPTQEDHIITILYYTHLMFSFVDGTVVQNVHCRCVYCCREPPQNYVLVCDIKDQSNKPAQRVHTLSIYIYNIYIVLIVNADMFSSVFLINCIVYGAI